MPIRSPEALALSPLEMLPFKSHRLGNGLKILVHEDHSIHSVAINFFYKVGSRNETAGRTGLAHFFEHMMFNGSKKFGPGLFDQIFESQGASNNAYTTRDVTVYQDWCPPEAVPVVFQLEADRMAQLSIDPIMVESERGVVANERRRYMAEPESVLDEMLFGAAYLAHPYRWPVLGWMSDIQNWTIADLEEFFHLNYSPNNCVLVVCGDVRAEDIWKQAEKAFAWIEARAEPRPVHTIEPAQLGERRVRIHDPSELPQFQCGWHTPSTSHDDFWALSTLEKLLFRGQSSIFYKTLIEQEHSLDLYGGFEGSSMDPGLFTIRTHLRSGVETQAVLDVIDKRLETLSQGEFQDKALEKAKNQVKAEFVRSLKTINGKADMLGAFEVFGEGPEEIAEVLEKYSQVQRADIERVVQTYLRPENRTVAELVPTPKFQPVRIRSEERAWETPPSPPSSDLEMPEFEVQASKAGFELPPARRFVLDNGLVIRLIERRQVPLLCSILSFGAGALRVPVGQDGLAPMVARLLRKGTEEHDEAELSERIDSVGALFGSTVGKRYLSLYTEFLSEYQDQSLELLEQVALRPTFPEKEFLKLQRRAVDSLKNDRTSARAVIDRYFFGALLGEHHCSRPSGGDENSVAALGREQVVDYHKRWFQPQNAYLVMAGDFDSEQMFERLNKTFGAWSSTADCDPVSDMQPQALTESRVLYVEKPDSDETVFQFGRLGLSRLHPDYARVSLLNLLLGGRFTSRLNTVLRIREGLTYGVSSDFMDFLNFGVFRVESFSANATSERAVDLALKVCKDFHKKGISADELDSAKAYLRGQMPTDFETHDQVAEWHLFLERRGLERAYISDCFDQVESLDLETANALVREHFACEALQFVFIGARDPVMNFAGKYGPVTTLRIEDSPYCPPYDR